MIGKTALASLLLLVFGSGCVCSFSLLPSLASSLTRHASTPSKSITACALSDKSKEAEPSDRRSFLSTAVMVALATACVAVAPPAVFAATSTSSESESKRENDSESDSDSDSDSESDSDSDSDSDSGSGSDSDNEFIQTLKARSDANRARYNQQARTPTKLDSTQFSRQYQRPTFVGIRRMDGSYKMVTPDVADDLQAKGLVIAKYDTYYDETKGVEKEDYRKGKVLQFPNAQAEAQARNQRAAPAPAPVSAP